MDSIKSAFSSGYEYASSLAISAKDLVVENSKIAIGAGAAAVAVPAIVIGAKKLSKPTKTVWQNFSAKTFQNKNKAIKVASIIAASITLGLLPAIVALASVINTKIQKVKADNVSSKRYHNRFAKYVGNKASSVAKYMSKTRLNTKVLSPIARKIKNSAVAISKAVKSHKKTTAALTLGLAAAAVGAYFYFGKEAPAAEAPAVEAPAVEAPNA